MPPPFLVAHLTLRGHSLSKLKYMVPEDAFTHMKAFLAKWFLKRIFLTNANKFSIFFNYLPLKLGVALHFYQFESLSLCLVKFGPVVKKIEVKNVKSLQTVGQTDAGDKMIRKVHLSFQLR